MFNKWFQLLHAVLNQWKKIIKSTNDSCTNIVYLDHHWVKNNRIVVMEKLRSKEIHSLIISQNMSPPTFKCFLFFHLNLDLKLIYLLLRLLTKNNSLRAFQYKVQNNVLYLNHKPIQLIVNTTSYVLFLFS